MCERRENRRFSVHEKVQLRVRAAGFFQPREELLSASVDDFGRGGFQLVCDRPLESRHRLSFAVHSPFLSHPLEGAGRIRYVKTLQKCGMPVYVAGVQFTSVNRRRVEGFIGRLNGWSRRTVFSESRRREAFFIMKALPFLLIVAWLVSGVFADAQRRQLREMRYTDKLKDAVIYGLYHMD